MASRSERFGGWDTDLNYPEKSIRIQLLFWLLAPLAILLLISGGVAYHLAVGFANNEYDKQLVNSADSVVARLRFDGSKLLVDLPPAAQAILRHNEMDKFYFQIVDLNGSRIAGDAILPKPRHNLDSLSPSFRDAILDGKAIRMARVRAPIEGYPGGTVFVQVAETLNCRNGFAHLILMSIMIPQLVLIMLGGFAVSVGVSRGLAPLKVLRDAVSMRSQFDLEPVSEAEAPVEVRPLIVAINDLLKRLREDVEFQRRFVANAAHQFRTPLAGLKTYIYAARRLPADGQMSTLLSSIDEGTDRLVHLSNKLLLLARSEPAERNESFEKVDLNLIASEVTALLVSEAMSRNLQLSFDGSSAPALIVGDSDNLAELATNLVENAVLYTEPGGDITVRVQNGPNVTLLVEDNGPGIPPEERERVFERFYRVLGTEAPGSGLGLPIVKEIALAHGATVSIDTPDSGKGTVIRVTFPLFGNK